MIGGMRSEGERGVRLQIAAATSVGRRRQDNQDYLLYRVARAQPDAAHDCSLFIAADGVGGAAGGAVASKLAAESVERAFQPAGSADPGTLLAEAITVAGAAVAERATAEESLARMATTLVAAVVRDNAAWVANVGDSRAYLVREGRAEQITNDHSFVAEAVRVGALSPAEAAHHPYRHMITRSLSAAGEAEPDVFGPLPLRPDDRLLLCTDGLTEPLTDEEISRLAAAGDPEQAAAALIDAANEAGGPDNVSVLLVAVCA
jgi:PPM family protein phosphatase